MIAKCNYLYSSNVTLYKLVKKIYSIHSDVNDNNNLLIRDSLRSHGLFASEYLAGCSSSVGWRAAVPLNCI